jgi:hypothetical protein
MIGLSCLHSSLAECNAIRKGGEQWEWWFWTWREETKKKKGKGRKKKKGNRHRKGKKGRKGIGFEMVGFLFLLFEKKGRGRNKEYLCFFAETLSAGSYKGTGLVVHSSLCGEGGRAEEE